MIPCLLSIWLYDETHRWKKALILLAVGAATFLTTVPYFLLDNSQFLRGIGYSASHYYKGFALYGPRGLPQLLHYMKGLVEAYGVAFVLVGVVGFFHQSKFNPKRTLILVSFPAALTLFMCCLAEHSWRNVLPAYCMFPVFVASGVNAIADKLRFRFAERVAASSIAIFGIFFLNFSLLKQHYRPYPETRVLAKRWLEASVEQGADLVVADELKFDRALEARYSVRRISVENTMAIKAFSQENKPIYFLMPKLSPYFATPGMWASLEALTAQPRVHLVTTFRGIELPARQYFVHFTSPTIVVFKK
jgi:hypothetical protein